MDLIECIEARKSVRGFSGEDVPDGYIMELIRIGNLAPSAGNLQARDFIVVRNRGVMDAITKVAIEFTWDMARAHQEFIRQAPVLIVCCANHERITRYGERGRNLYCIQDVAASVENMLLHVTVSGYASCWIGGFDEKAVAELLHLPPHVRPVAMMPIGRPTKEGRQRSRIGTKDLVHFEKW